MPDLRLPLASRAINSSKSSGVNVVGDEMEATANEEEDVEEEVLAVVCVSPSFLIIRSNMGIVWDEMCCCW